MESTTSCFLCRKDSIRPPTSPAFFNWKKHSAHSLCDVLNIQPTPCSQLLAKANYCEDCYKVLFDIHFLESSIQQLQDRKQALAQVAQELLLQRYDDISEQGTSDIYAEGTKLIVEQIAIRNMDLESPLIKTEVVKWETPAEEQGVCPNELNQFKQNWPAFESHSWGYQGSTLPSDLDSVSYPVIDLSVNHVEPNEIPNLHTMEPQLNSTQTHPESGQNGLRLQRRKYKKFVIDDHIRILRGRGGAELLYECTICKRSFKSKQHVNYHQSCKTGVDPFRCERCDLGFKTKMGFDYHLRNHDNPRRRPGRKGIPIPGHISILQGGDNQIVRYECTVCKTSFKSKQYIASHQRCITGVDPFWCKKCGRSYRSKIGYNYHLQHHDVARHNKGKYQSGHGDRLKGVGEKRKKIPFQETRYPRRGALPASDARIGGSVGSTAMPRAYHHEINLERLPELVLRLEKCDSMMSKGDDFFVPTLDDVGPAGTP